MTRTDEEWIIARMVCRILGLTIENETRSDNKPNECNGQAGDAQDSQVGERTSVMN
jgi:hypothetical protein